MLFACSAALLRPVIPGGNGWLAGVLLVVLALPWDRAYKAELGGVYFLAARGEARQILVATEPARSAGLEGRQLVVDPRGLPWPAAVNSVLGGNSKEDPVSVVVVPDLASVPTQSLGDVYLTDSGFRRLEAPPGGVLPLGALYADGWAGKDFAVRADCAQLVLSFTSVCPPGVRAGCRS